MKDSSSKKVTVAREPNRSTLERLAHHWGYTLEETAEIYAVLVKEAAVPPSRVEESRLRRLVERRDEFIIASGLWDAFREACRG